MKTKPKTIAAYLAGTKAGQRACLIADWHIDDAPGKLIRTTKHKSE